MHTIERNKLVDTPIDIEGRDILIGFNEPAFRYSSKKATEPDLDAKLNARLITYFLPAVEVARQQKQRPRFWVVSGLNMALRWNARNEEERKIMIANNKLKLDFLKTFFEVHFINDFSVIEYVTVQDPIRVPEETLLKIWRLVEMEYPAEVKEISYYLARFKKPHEYNVPYSNNSQKSQDTSTPQLQNAFKYAVSHLFVFGDVNFDGNYVLNPKGFASIGGHQERIFNKIRLLALEVIKRYGWLFVDDKIILLDNIRIILEEMVQSPVPYSGCYKQNGNEKLYLEEVTYENNQPLNFYDSHPKLKYPMEYMYSHLLSKKEYEAFWDSYRQRYLDIKERLREAYAIHENW